MSTLKNHALIAAIALVLLAFFLLVDLTAAMKITLLVFLTCLTLAAVSPRLGLYLLIAIRPCLDVFTDQPLFSLGGLNLNPASLFASLAILFAVVMAIKNFSKIKKLPLKYNWLIFCALVLSSVFFSFNPASSLAESARLLSVLALYWLAFLLIDSERDLKNLIVIVLISAAVPAALAVWQFYTSTGLTVPFEGIYNRIYGTFAHPNLFAYYLLLPLSLSLGMFLSGDKKRLNMFLYFLLAAALAVILAMTFTRGAWLSLLAVISFIGLLRYRGLLLAGLAIAALAYFFIQPINYRVNDLMAGRSDSSIAWRLSLWADVQTYVKEQPLFGHGAGVANELILDRRGEQFGSSDPHNDYLKLALENGLVGLAAYLILVAGLFYSLLKKYLSANGPELKTLLIIAAGLSLSFYAMSAADNILRNTALMWSFWAVLGALLAQKNNLEKSFS